MYNLIHLKLYYIRVDKPRQFKSTTYMVGYRGNLIYLNRDSLKVLHFKLYGFIKGLKHYNVHICCFVGSSQYTRISRWVAIRINGSWALNLFKRGP